MVSIANQTEEIRNKNFTRLRHNIFIYISVLYHSNTSKQYIMAGNVKINTHSLAISIWKKYFYSTYMYAILGIDCNRYSCTTTFQMKRHDISIPIDSYLNEKTTTKHCIKCTAVGLSPSRRLRLHVCVCVDQRPAIALVEIQLSDAHRRRTTVTDIQIIVFYV